jgi:hypothetical protein
VTLKGRVADITEKEGRSGVLDVVVLETTGYDQKGEKIFIARMTLLSKRM